MSRPLLTIAASAGLVIALSACAPEPVSRPSSSTAGPSATQTTTPTPTATASATPSAAPAALPASCDQLYSADLLATLNADIPPLNDPALGDFLSTENVAGLEALGSGAPTLRCTWGAAGTPGLATTVAQLAADGAAGIRQSLEGTGFACGDLEGGTVCRFSQETIDQSDRVRTNGETHWFGNGIWVATHWVDYDPEGYTRDVVASLPG